MSGDCVDFVLGLMTVDPSQRLTAAQAAQHPWLTQSSAEPPRAARPQGRSPRPSYTKEDTTQDSTALVENLKTFKEHTKIKQSALLALCFTLDSSCKDLTVISDTFSRMDTDQNGTLSLREFSEAMVAHGVTDRAQIEAAFNAIDLDNAGLIQYSEFVAAALEESAYAAKERVEAAFHALDLDDSGAITVEDFRLLLGGSDGADIDPAMLDNIIGP